VGKQGKGFIISTTTPSAPNTSAAIERYLCHGTAQLRIGVGYVGSLQGNVEIGDVIIPISAERGEGTSHHYLPAQHFPPHRTGKSDSTATPSSRLQASLVKHAERKGLRYHLGKLYTTDSFYMELEQFLKKLNKSQFLGIDMETSAPFIIAGYHGKEAAAILVVSDKPYPKPDYNLVCWDGQDFVFGKSETPSRVFLKAIEVAMETLLEFV
jgi:purine-nucleoside phosphorylase